MTITLRSISMLFVPMHLLILRDDVTENSSIDVGEWTSVPTILYKVDVCLYEVKKTGFDKIFLSKMVV